MDGRAAGLALASPLTYKDMFMYYVRSHSISTAAVLMASSAAAWLTAAATEAAYLGSLAASSLLPTSLGTDRLSVDDRLLVMLYIRVIDRLVSADNSPRSSYVAAAAAAGTGGEDDDDDDDDDDKQSSLSQYQKSSAGAARDTRDVKHHKQAGSK